MGEHKPWAERFSEEIDAFVHLWRNRRWLAIIFMIALLVGCIIFLAISYERGRKIDELRSENRELKRDLRQIESENKGLRETVAPLLARAAKEFPGEEINISLKKIITSLKSQDPLHQPITSATATVELTIKSDDKVDSHFMDRGGYAIFGKDTTPLLLASSHESWGRQTGQGEVLYRGIFTMPADYQAVGKSLEFLTQAEYVQAEFLMMPAGSLILNGKIIFVINGSIRLEFSIPQQTSDERRVFVRDLSEGLGPLTYKKSIEVTK